MDLKKQPDWALKNMIKALSGFELLNTEEENERLASAKKELKERKMLMTFN